MMCSEVGTMQAGGRNLKIVAGLIFGAMLLRIVPHPPNFSPALAASLLAGATLGTSVWAFALPLAGMLAADSLLELATGQGFHAQMPVVYGTLAAVVLLGRWLARSRRAGQLAGASLAGSTLFYLVTNFAVWASGTLYPHTLAGLASCYLAALPFFGLSILGDLTFTALLFASYAYLAKHLGELSRA
jgi:hypothetical protein